jgi:spectinomycin phosphotransferase
VLEKPDLRDERIIACLQVEFGLLVDQLTFLPLGADRNTAVYRVVADDETPYFLKLRRGVFDETAVALPRFLSDQGIAQIIAPLRSKTGRLWSNLDAFKLILFPFVEGHDGYEIGLSDRQWVELGTALKRIHMAIVPPSLIRRIQKETFSPHWRENVRTFLERAEDDASDDPVAVELDAFLTARRDEIFDLVGRAERLAQALQANTPEFILCHSDIHAGNILIDAGGALYIVDWDNPILAPKERDLMFIGGGQFGAGRTPLEEENLFYRGYGRTQIDPTALAYYRYERIVQDIAVFCEQLFLTNEGGEDREQSLRYLTSNFLPGNTMEIAHMSDKTLREAQAKKRKRHPTAQ